MRTILSIFLLIAVGSLMADAFVWGKSNKTTTTKAPKTACDSKPCKNGGTCKLDPKYQFVCECLQGFHGQFCQLKTKSSICDPNPCSNKAACVLNPKNVKQATCNCSEGYHGTYCELHTGCYKKPCRKGQCIVDPKFPSNYTCKCEKGFLGPNCDIVDGCAKNPCKNGVCSLDAKNKVVCKCSEGWGSKTCDKRNCTIVQFKGKHLAKGSNKLYIDQSVQKAFEDLDGLAQLCKVKIHILRSFVLNPNPKAITFDKTDKTHMLYYVGRAANFEIYDEHDKLLCNDICLGKIPIPNKEAKCFVDGLHAIRFKWSILDPTTVHTGDFVADYSAYNRLREHHQVGCRDTKF